MAEMDGNVSIGTITPSVDTDVDIYLIKGTSRQVPLHLFYQTVFPDLFKYTECICSRTAISK
jgi:hypothetical protein